MKKKPEDPSAHPKLEKTYGLRMSSKLAERVGKEAGKAGMTFSGWIRATLNAVAGPL